MASANSDLILRDYLSAGWPKLKSTDENQEDLLNWNITF
jgi:hypothetical protein